MIVSVIVEIAEVAWLASYIDYTWIASADQIKWCGLVILFDDDTIRTLGWTDASTAHSHNARTPPRSYPFAAHAHTR